MSNMVSKVGYDFYFYDQTETSQLLVFPITPPKLDITIGSRNETVELINEGQINLLKSPALADIEFQARFPAREYPYSRYPLDYETYFAIFRSLKANKIPFRFIMIRTSVYNKYLGVRPGADTDTYRKRQAAKAIAEKVRGNDYSEYETPVIGDSNYNILCTIEEMKITEDANEGDDILIDFKLRQWKPYGLKVFRVKGDNSTTSSSAQSRTVLTPVTAQLHTVTDTDELNLITKKYYGSDDYELRQRIYDANADVIEAAAKKHGKRSSVNGFWIFPGTVLTIPIKG